MTSRRLKQLLVICGVLFVVVVSSSMHARNEAERLSALLMEPKDFPAGYDRAVRFETLDCAWTVWYVFHAPYEPSASVSVSLLGHIDLTSKYFVDRAAYLGIP